MFELNTQQKKAVFEIKSNCLVSASPGSGKTRTLVARAQYQLESLPQFKSLALITYTNAGADEIYSRISTDKDIFIGTIHSFCLEYILRPFGWLYKWNKPIVISYEQQEEFLNENADIDLGENGIEELGKIKKTITGEIDTQTEWEHQITREELAERYYDYQENIKVIDFNEILYRSHKIVEENEFVAKSLASKFQEILVDEFQDTNLFQYEILKKINQSGDCVFFMVGDEKQRIFSFAGAIKDAFEIAKNDFDAVQIDLIQTYRSTDSIVSAYSALFNGHPEIQNESLHKNSSQKVIFKETKSKTHTASVRGIIDKLISTYKISPSSIAILSTSWFNAYDISRELRTDYNIVGLGALPHRKSIGSSTFSLLRSLSRFHCESSGRNLKGVKRNIVHVQENGLEFSQRMLHSKTNNLISRFCMLDETENLTNGMITIKGIFDNIFDITHSTFDEILELISEEEKGAWTIGQYISTLAEVNGITNNTIHKVKGLEFDVVILNSMNENRIPYQKCLCRNPWTYEPLSNDSLEEGRNLFYVAVSRAKKILIILHNWKPSMFINDIK